MHVCTLVVLISTAAAPPSPWAPRGPGSLKSALYERCWSPTARPSWFRRQACLSFGDAERSILPGRGHFHHPLPPSPISSMPKAELLRFVGSSNKWALVGCVCVFLNFSVRLLVCQLFPERPFFFFFAISCFFRSKKKKRKSTMHRIDFLNEALWKLEG